MIERGIDTFVIDTSALSLVSLNPIGEGGTSFIYLVKDFNGNEYVAKVAKKEIMNYQEEKSFIRELMILSKCNENPFNGNRDLKPDNVLLNDFLHPKITDFGLSKIQYDEQQSMNDKGTLFYIAPDILNGDSTYTNSVDVYSFGIMAFEIITLQLPYILPPNSNFFRFVGEVLKGKRPSIPPTMNPNLKDLICSCWSSDGNERPTFAQIFECLSKPDYFIPGVDPNEYNAYLNSLNDDSIPLCLEPSVQLIVDQANKGNVEMMKQAADGFFEGVDKFPFDKDQALKYYRMHAFATSPAKINEMGSSTSQTAVDEFQNETSSQEDQRDQKQKQSLSPSTFIYRSDSDTQSNPLIDTDSLNSISPSTFTYTPDTVVQSFTDQERLSFLPPDIRSKIKDKESSEELFEIGDNFQNGSNSFPQSYQLSSYFFRIAFLALRNETKNEFNDKDEEFHIEPISKPRYSSMGGRPQSGFIQPQHISVIPIDFRPICFQALKANIPHVNILINGNVTSISPVVKTMKSNQNAPEFDVDGNFMRFDIDGKGITIFHAKNGDSIFPEYVTNFIKERVSPTCDPYQKLLMCLYCISPSNNRDIDEKRFQIIKSISKLICTVVFVTDIVDNSFVERLKKSVKGKIFNKEKKENGKKLKKTILIFDMKLCTQQTCTCLIQDFINFFPNISLV